MDTDSPSLYSKNRGSMQSHWRLHHGKDMKALIQQTSEVTEETCGISAAVSGAAHSFKAMLCWRKSLKLSFQGTEKLLKIGTEHPVLVGNNAFSSPYNTPELQEPVKLTWLSCITQYILPPDTHLEASTYFLARRLKNTLRNVSEIVISEMW